jgi:hypothetical protein
MPFDVNPQAYRRQFSVRPYLDDEKKVEPSTPARRLDSFIPGLDMENAKRALFAILMSDRRRGGRVLLSIGLEVN